MVFHDVAEIFAPMQIMMVLVIALLVFGPKRLPDLGRSIGTALRELNKAKNDMMKTFTLDHEPEQEPYKYDNQNSDYSYNSSYHYSPAPETPDLTDYTIAGMPPKETPAIEGTVARGSYDGNGYDPAASADYMIASPTPAGSAGASSNFAEAVTHSESASTSEDAGAPHKGEQNV